MKYILLLCGACLAAPDIQESSGINKRTMAAGEKLYLYDRASAAASDAMVERWKDYGKHTLNGYLAIREGKSWRVVYTGEHAGHPASYFEVRLAEDLGKADTAFENTPPRRLSAVETRMYAASRTADRLERRLSCSKHYNRILVPNDSGWSVYFLAATTERGKIMVGGHYRADMDASGGKLVGSEQFTNSCLDIPIAQGVDKEPTAFVTHLRSKLPNEVHYYLTRLYNLKLFVGIGEDLWVVTRDAMVYLGDIDTFKGGVK